MESVQAIIQFLVDVFSALAQFLTGEGGTFDLSGLFGGLISGTEGTSDEAAG